MTKTGSNKIVFAIHSLQAGGMERVMVELIHHFSKKSEIDLHVILYGITREIFYVLPENITIHKPGFPFNDRFRLISTIRTLFYLRKVLKQLKPDSVLSFGEFWNNFVLLATIGQSFPVYVSDRSQPNKSLGKLHDYLRKVLYPRATGVIVQTERAKKIYQQLYVNPNMTVIGNPIRKIALEDDVSVDKQNKVLMVGRLIESKHQDELIHIFAKINMKGWQLVLVGGDHLKQKNKIKLERLVQTLGMEGQIILTGKRLDVEQFYLRSKIFAFTSSSEGFPNVIGEAMSAGLPVIAYDCVAGPSEMIEDGVNGYLVATHDEITFAERLKLLMEEPNRALVMGQAAQKSIQKYSLESIGDQFLAFILPNLKR